MTRTTMKEVMNIRVQILDCCPSHATHWEGDTHDMTTWRYHVWLAKDDIKTYNYMGQPTSRGIDWVGQGTFRITDIRNEFTGFSSDLNEDEKLVLKHAPIGAVHADYKDAIITYYSGTHISIEINVYDVNANVYSGWHSPSLSIENQLMQHDIAMLRSAAPKGKKPELPRSKYIRTFKDKHGNTMDLDVYDVIEAFNLACPALQHAAKKILCAGIRGHKDVIVDLDDAIASIERGKDLHHNRDNT